MTSSTEDDSVMITASRMTAGMADLLAGTWVYPCRHRFSWILDYCLPRTGRRAPDVHTCPKCSENPTCLVCLRPFDPAADSCASCEEFFVESLLRERRRKLEALNVRVLDEKGNVCLRARLEVERARFLEKWGALPVGVVRR
ncbi:hypothetical protein F4861DRAFT_543766 [Xylaria intraflava]|nr:hypothetical protein F4861DRAFT_543766 [Xylaria intraflava]